MIRIIFIRHPETEINTRGFTHRIGEQTRFTDEGNRQLNILLFVISQYGIQKVYSSPEKRAKDTAELISKELEIKMVVLDELDERNWGDWAGWPWEAILDKLDRMNIEERFNFIPPGGESWREMEMRSKKALQVIISGEETCVLVVIHAGILRNLMPVLKDASREISFGYDFRNASVTIFDYEDGKYKEIIINDVSHLEKV